MRYNDAHHKIPHRPSFANNDNIGMETIPKEVSGLNIDITTEGNMIGDLCLSSATKIPASSNQFMREMGKEEFVRLSTKFKDEELANIHFGEFATTIERGKLEGSCLHSDPTKIQPSESSDKRIVKEERFAEMTATLEKIKKEYPVLKKIIERYRVLNDDKLVNYVLGLMDRRLERLPVRAYFFRKVWEYIEEWMVFEGGVLKTNSISRYRDKISFILEVIIVIQYYHNQILDGKHSIDSKEKINRNLIAGNILRVALCKYVDEEMEELREKKQCIKDTICKMLLYVDIGQRMDKCFDNYENYKNQDFPEFLNDEGIFSELLYENKERKEKLSLLDAFKSMDDIEVYRKEKHYWEQDKSKRKLEHLKKQVGLKKVKEDIPLKERFVELYFRRIFLTNAVLFPLATNMALELLEYKGKEAINLMKFSSCYGMALQIVNDNADFIPRETNSFVPEEGRNLKIDTTGKSSGDGFSDLRNGTLTLPLIYHLAYRDKKNSGEDIVSGILKKKNEQEKEFILDDNQKLVLRELKMSKAITDSMKVGYNIANLGYQYLLDAAQKKLELTIPEIKECFTNNLEDQKELQMKKWGLSQHLFLKELLRIARWNKFYKFYTE